MGGNHTQLHTVFAAHFAWDHHPVGLLAYTPHPWPQKVKSHEELKKDQEAKREIRKSILRWNGGSRNSNKGF